jgi:hypothetical protein
MEKPIVILTKEAAETPEQAENMERKLRAWLGGGHAAQVDADAVLEAYERTKRAGEAD